MWLHVRAYDADARRSCSSPGATCSRPPTLVGYGALPSDPDYDPYLHVWETVHGMSPALAAVAGIARGPVASTWC